MKTNFRTLLLLFNPLIFVLCLGSVRVYSQDASVTILSEPKMYYFGAVISGVTAGYGETSVSDVMYNNQKMIMLDEKVVVKHRQGK